MKSSLKVDLRAEIRSKRRALSEDERTESVFKVTQQFTKEILPILNRVGWVTANRTIAGFSNLPEELSLFDDILRFRSDSPFPCYVLPRMVLNHSGKSELSFHQVAEDAVLVQNRLGILEPDFSWPQVLVSDIDWFWTPGVAWDRSGNRLGMGKGFYDRIFSENATAIRVGVGFSFQCVQTLEVEPWDQKVDALILPDEVILQPSFYDKLSAR